MLLFGCIVSLLQGKHGLSLNVYGDIREGGPSCGGHFNPFGKNHGAPGDEERHVGSLGMYFCS